MVHSLQGQHQQQTGELGMIVPSTGADAWQHMAPASAVRGGEYSMPGPPLLQGLRAACVQLLHLHGNR